METPILKDQLPVLPQVAAPLPVRRPDLVHPPDGPNAGTERTHKVQGADFVATFRRPSL